jgi:hypothetical protein
MRIIPAVQQMVQTAVLEAGQVVQLEMAPEMMALGVVHTMT